MKSTAKLFADDTKLYNQVTRDNSEGADQIQHDLETLEKWSDTWLLVCILCIITNRCDLDGMAVYKSLLYVCMYVCMVIEV